MKILKYFFLLHIFLLSVACTNQSGNSPLLEETEVIKDPGSRSLLTFDQLMYGFDYASPISELAFARPADAQSPLHIFSGRLELLGEESTAGIEILRGDPTDGPDLANLPQFDFFFVQYDDYLVPLRRGLIITDHPTWNYLIEPGRVWREAGDEGFSRASFPFSITPKGGNSTYNGTMAFLFNDTEVSNVWYQITQETSFYFRANFWGLLGAAYHPGPISNAEAVRANFTQELAERFPTKPIEALGDDYPGIDHQLLTRGISPQHLTSYGFVVDNVNYVSGCNARYGPYYYCEYMRAPSWSTAKSAFASFALMRLAQKYGSNVAELLIKDYVPEYVDSPGDWSQVTFDHTLDMATGNFGTSSRMVDEINFDTDPFWLHEDYAGKIEAAFQWPHGADPGSQWVYHTPDTFILTRAMHNYLQSMEGPDADIFEFVVDEVFLPINLGPGALTTLRTSDENWQGQAIGGFGLWWVQDDFAKISALLHQNGFAHGEQILLPDFVQSALQRNAADRGVRIDSRSMYNNSFWATKYGPGQVYDCEFWVSQMQGFSGVVLVLMPNGTTFYYFSDNQEFEWTIAVSESNKIYPHCPSAD